MNQISRLIWTFRPPDSPWLNKIYDMWMPYGRRTEQSGDGAGSTRVSEDSLHHRINISWKEPLNRNAQPLAPPPRVPPNLGKSGRPFCSFSNFHFEMNKHPGNPMVGAAIPICKCILCKYIHFRERDEEHTGHLNSKWCTFYRSRRMHRCRR